ncbi:hypothetical protein BH10PLA2_BH10PLA2_09420 [soil metagenome]
MATLDRRRTGYRLIFYYQGTRFQHPLKTADKREAGQLKSLLERNLDLLQQGALQFPDGADLGVFLLSSGKQEKLPKAEKRMGLGDFFERNRADRPVSKEKNTTYTEEIHLQHFLRILGTRTPVLELPGRLQEYVNLRSLEDGRGDAKISNVTIKKELGTLCSVWNKWAVPTGVVQAPLSIKNLRHAKQKEKPPFQTWEQIERKIGLGESSDLWECLFLTVDQVEQLLTHVRTNASLIREHERRFAFTYPMFAFVAHTGARRSEMLRSRRSDIDFKRNEITIREKKKDTSRAETYRHVPMTALLRDALQNWFGVHPGGEFTYCRETGEAFTTQMASHHFRWALEGSKWKVLSGWHVFRHSFISNLASRGIGQRVIMGLVGHLCEETTKRYSHLFPSTVQDAMRLVFGDGQRTFAVADPG